VDLAMPGTLPVLNREAVHMAVKFGVAIGADIARVSVFDRKNYFYPDLPKGYQISQLDYPIVGRGEVEVALPDGSSKRIGITRAHLEEDAGKSLHEDFHGLTGIDLNRAGTPLLEIVSEPEIRSAQEAVAYLKQIHSIIRYLGISDGNMAEGSMRCDINLSLRRPGDEKFGTRCEIKNVNSFRFVDKAIETERERQADILEHGGSVKQETRLYDAERNETRSMRSKEVAHDYRYFPEPDLLPVHVSEELIESIRAGLPELPAQKVQRFRTQFGLGAYDAAQLAASRELAEYFEAAATGAGDAKTTANWVLSELLARINRDGLEISACPVAAASLGTLIARIQDGTISGKIAKTVFEAMWAGEGEPDAIIATKGLRQMADSGAIEQLVDDALAANAGQVEQYRATPADKRQRMFGFFVGQVMKASQGKANPQQVNDLLRNRLDGE
jgi:aspartyl-tRNA(Asn)/glutamyl-tRNA(Gln) amidotransferase subunit B